MYGKCPDAHILQSLGNLFYITGIVVPSEPGFHRYGREVDFTTAEVSLTIRPISFKTPAPAPRMATFFTGQPKFMSSRSG
jgi:hypothetical protein